MKIIFQKNIIALGVAAMVSVSGLSAQTKLAEPLAPVSCITIGANVYTQWYTSSVSPFVDIFKSNIGWKFAEKSNGQKVNLDENGYITTNAAGAYTTINLENIPVNMEFTVMWDGAATNLNKNPLILAGFKIIENSFQQTSSGGSVRVMRNFDTGFIKISESQNTVVSNNPVHIRNIRIIRKGFENTYLDKPFNPEFVEQVAKMQYVKFNAFMSNSIEDKVPKDWESRTTINSMSQSVKSNAEDLYDSYTANIAYEYMIKLANITEKDIWINIPYNADSIYVAKMAKLFKDNLNTKSKVYVETSNEIWDFGRGVAMNYFYNLNNKNVTQTEAYIAKLIKRNWRIWKNMLEEKAVNTLGAQVQYWPNAAVVHFGVNQYKGADKCEVIALRQSINFGNQEENVKAKGAKITPVELNQYLLEAWKNGSAFNYSSSPNTKEGLVEWSKAAKSINAKIMLYEFGVSYRFSDYPFNEAPNSELAGNHKETVTPLLIAALDTLKKYGVESACYFALNGDSLYYKYGLLGNTFSPSKEYVKGYNADTKYTAIKTYLDAQNCKPNSVFDKYQSVTADNIVVYPNPTNGSVQISSTDFGANLINVECFNSLGSKVYEGQIRANENVDILSNEPQGVYQLNIIENGKKTSKKIVKQ